MIDFSAFEKLPTGNRYCKHPRNARRDRLKFRNAASKRYSQDEASTDVVALLDMTLGDILLAALRKDPQGAGRIFARAVFQAVAAAKAGEPKTEL